MRRLKITRGKKCIIGKVRKNAGRKKKVRTSPNKKRLNLLINSKISEKKTTSITHKIK